ncbi:ABC transporter permease [Devosia epidermidihirudinis]|uniref:ABC transporter permease n=1 Tax=Devosia epidermidihirudinis TaxID=1293439 RepID=A0A0F5QB87_9HYPH|nr:ABC transporter permease [Devosia epidermidihirudinis]KKC37986.1 ABC transporter permease [Devosia epidermidihirudinis]
MTQSRRIFRSLLRNFLQAIPTIFIIVTLGFFMLQLAPGDAADFMAAEAGSATAETMAQLRSAFGLDLPLLSQLGSYYAGLANFSLGHSLRYGMPVSELIMQRLPGTITLMAAAIVLAVSLGLLAGTVMGMRPGRWPDRILSVLSLLFYSVPAFWIGLMLIVFFSIRLGWLPTGGGYTLGAKLSGLDWFVDRARHLALPALSLALYYVAIYARLVRASVIEAKSQDHVRTAIAKGMGRYRLIRVHILRSALGPITAMVGMHVAGILGGAVVIETVFSWPGMGRLAYEAILSREYTVLLGILIVSALLVIAMNAIFDIVQSLLDPRVAVR